MTNQREQLAAAAQLAAQQSAFHAGRAAAFEEASRLVGQQTLAVGQSVSTTSTFGFARALTEEVRK